jgi:hypothetical protein
MFEVVAGEAMPQRVARPIGDPGAFPVCLQFYPQIDGAELSGLATVGRKPRSQSWSDRDVTACGGFGLTSSNFHQTSLKIDVLPFLALQFSTAQPAPAAERPVGERLRAGALQELPELFRTQDSGFRAFPFGFLDLSKRIGCAPPATPSEFEQNGEAQPEGVPGQRSDAQITEPCLDLIKTEFGDFARPEAALKAFQPVTEIFDVTRGKPVLFLCSEQLRDNISDRFAVQDVGVVQAVVFGRVGQRGNERSQDIERRNCVPAFLGSQAPGFKAMVGVLDVG